MRVRKFNPLLYEKLKDAQGGGYFRALRASSSYTLKKKFLRNSEGKLYLSLFEKGHFCVGGVLNIRKKINPHLLQNQKAYAASQADAGIL